MGKNAAMFSLPHKEILPYAWYRFAQGLLAPLKRENVHVISLVRDPATSEAFASKIPQTSQLKIRDLEDILTGNSKLGQTGLRDALKPLSEEVLLIIGHVNSGKFEYKNEKGQIVQTPFDELFAAANENKVNLVPLGCESSIWAPIGLSHKINSIDVVTALGNYFTQPSDNSDVYGLFRFITGPNMILTVDPVNFQLYQRIEVSRQDGNVVAELYWAPPQTITPETMTTIAKQIATKHLPAPPWIREKLAAYHRAYWFGFESLIGALLISLLLGIFDSSMMEEEDYLPALFASHVLFGFFLLGLALRWVSTEAGVSFPLILSLIFLALLVGGWRIGNIWRVRFTILLIASILLLRAKLML